MILCPRTYSADSISIAIVNTARDTSDGLRSEKDETQLKIGNLLSPHSVVPFST